MFHIQIFYPLIRNYSHIRRYGITSINLSANHLKLPIEADRKNSFKISFHEYLLGSKQPDVYSGYRKPCLEKLAEMVVFFTQELEPWKTKLNKLLFYADFLQFRKTCFSVSGVRYRAIDMGPVLNNFNSIFEYMGNNDDVDVYQTEFPDDKIGEQFKPNSGRIFLIRPSLRKMNYKLYRR